ncbi:MAG: thrombospondin type 3 repeat-containing protein [Acidobacteriota bacterium]
MLKKGERRWQAMTRPIVILVLGLSATSASVFGGGSSTGDETGGSWPSGFDFSAQGVTGCWPLEGDAVDVSGNHPPGLVVDGQVVPGIFGQAYRLSTQIDYVDLRAPVDNLQPFSVAFWVRPENPPFNGVARMISTYTNATGEGGFDIHFNSGHSPPAHFRMYTIGTNQISADSEISLEEWQHFAAVWNGTEAAIYRNGSLVDTASPIGQFDGSSETIKIGALGLLAARHEDLVGTVDEVVLFDRAIDAHEINLLASDDDGDGVADFWTGGPAPPDGDGDGTEDQADNCPLDYNPDQEDLDGDGQGDACDFDDDDDGVDDEYDNCPLISNSDQDDNDLDEEGDACDADDDNDTVLDTSDNCPLTANTDQQDSDEDGTGDVCDLDDDNDGVEDDVDNCPFSVNSNQSDIDGDGLGDVCDADADGDGIDDLSDNCPLDPNSDQEDFDGDGLGDACDLDDDDDLVDDTEDNCPFVFNQDQADLDGDGIGDACDADVDGDGINDSADNCPLTQNTSQDDADGDGLGDACDVDDDGDGIDDGVDNCPLVANPGQADFDGDGIGNKCDLDIDGDGIDTAVDNCPLRPNPSQRDFDGDGIGNRCDRDRDGDGVRNRHDRCPFTPPGTVVAPGNGCSIEQLVPCDGPRGMSRPWRNHGQYMRALTQTAKRFVQLGLITQQEKDDVVSAGAQSQCGH